MQHSITKKNTTILGKDWEKQLEAKRLNDCLCKCPLIHTPKNKVHKYYFPCKQHGVVSVSG